MISHLTIRGLGPHESTDLDLDPTGPTWVRGPSEAGKSAIVRSVMFVLYGLDVDGAAFPVDAIHEGASRMEVDLTFAKSGLTLSRTMTAARSQTRKGSKDGSIVAYANDEGMLRAIGPLADRELGRIVMVPGAWQALAQGPGGGRPLRDFLARVLPGATEESILDERLEPHEPRNPKGAEESRKLARKAAAVAEGSLATRREHAEHFAARRVVGPTAEEVESAREAIRAYDQAVAASEGQRAALQAWREQTQAAQAARAALTAWTARRDRLQAPREAEPTEAELAGLRSEVAGLSKVVEDRRAKLAALPAVPDTRAALEAHADAASVLDEVGRRIERATEAAGLLDGVPCGGRLLQIATPTVNDRHDLTPVECGSCPLLTTAQAARASLPGLEEQESKCRAALQAATAASEKAEVVATRTSAAQGKAQAAVTEAEAKLADKRAALDRLTATARAWAAHREAEAALGPEPKVPADHGPAPQVSTPAEPIDARRVLRAVEAAERDAARHAEDLREATDAVTVAEEALAKAQATAARAEEVVAIVRAAPGEALRGKLDAVQTEHLRVVVPEDGDAIRVEVHCGGDRWLPWHLASTGRRIVADLAFRAALRSAVGLGPVPLFVDEVQSVGGLALPEVAGPVVYLVTTADEALEVQTGRREAA